MPQVDKPIDELKAYRGINPRPADFDAYWDESLREMRAVDPDVKLVPYPLPTLGVEAFEMTFTGVGGARVFAKLLRPAVGKEKGPGLVMFHGYTGASPSWMYLLSYALSGFTVAAMDCRGQGGRSEDVGGVKGTTHNGHIIRGLEDPDPKKLLFRSIFLDAAQLAGLVMAMPGVDEKRVGAMGGSQGGGLTLACAALEPRVAVAVPEYPFLTDYLRVWQMDLAQEAYEEIRTFFRRYDPQHERHDEIFTKLGYIDIQHLACRIRANVLMGCGLMDTICPPSTQFAAYNKITSPKDVCFYPDFGHEGLPGFEEKGYRYLMAQLNS